MESISKLHERGLRILRAPALTALLGTLALAACSDAVLPEITTWEGQLTPLSPAGRASGSVAAVSNAGQTQTAIQILGGEDGRTYVWRIASGTCSDMGDVVGGLAVYPVLTPGPEGTATAETILSRELAPDGTYSAWLYLRAQGDGAETVSACGALDRKR